MRFAGAMLSLFLLIVVAVSASAQSATTFEYRGGRHTNERVQEALNQVQPLVPVAIERAESLLEMRIDPARLELVLQDLPSRRRGKTTPRMRVQGQDREMLIAYLEPILRGDYADSDALLRTLTHEMIHVAVRQGIAHSDYRRLPEWFQEGLPHYLLGQSPDKLLTMAAHEHQNLDAIFAGFSGDHQAWPEITGGYFLAELEARLGQAGWQRFLGGVLDEGTVRAGMERVELLDAEMSVPDQEEALKDLWSAARDRARADLDRHAGVVAANFASCMRDYDEGGADRGLGAMACFQELIDSHPESYAAEISTYWLAKCHYRRGEFEPALAALDRFDSFAKHYGLLDNSRYYRIRLYQELGKAQELRKACRDYLDLFPDGADFGKVSEISQY